MTLTERSRQRAAGILFLCAFFAYGVGTAMVAPLVDAGNATAVLLAR